MKTIPQLLTLTILAIALAGCAYLQKAADSPLFIGAGKVALSLTQAGVDSAMQTILIRAKSPADLEYKGSLLDSAARGLRTLQGATAGLVTPDIVVDTVRQYTNPDAYHWSDYAGDLAAAFSSSTLPPNKKLEALAVSADEAASKARAQAGLALPTSDGKSLVVP